MTLLPKRFLADPNTIHETLKWVIIIEVVTTLVFVFAMFYITNKKTPANIDQSIIEEMKAANAEHLKVLDMSAKNEAKLSSSIDYRDSIFRADYNKRQETYQIELINKRNKNNEKVNSYNSFQSKDIRSAFSRLRLDTTGNDIDSE